MMTLPGYRLHTQLYESSRTVIVQGTRQSDQIPVILKLLKSDAPTLTDQVRLRNHYTIASQLNDLPGIVHPIALEQSHDRLALVMLDEGMVSLHRYYTDARRNADPDRVASFLAIALQLADILDGLYRHRVIHKDIKPSNILIHPDTGLIKLTDFGLASQLPQETQELQPPSLLEGTLAYLSPEQTGRMNRGIDYRSDFYSLGVTFYELLTGQLPFQSDDPLELVYCHLAKEPVLLSPTPDSRLPTPLINIVLKLMAKNAEDRYQSALGLKVDLEMCLEQYQTTGAIADFPLGQVDDIAQFSIPQKLYGREPQIKTLLTTFERVSQGSCELVAIGGYSGVGKTALVNAILRQLTQHRGYFAAGKFDQFQRDVPLAGVLQAYRGLIRQLLTESDERLHYWRDRFTHHLGANAQLIIDAVPELALIIGPQPPVPTLGAMETANRLVHTFNQFARAFQSPDHPQVVFMDDVQWADLASLQSLQNFMLNNENCYVLLIVAYRDNEVNATHPLMQTIGAIRQTESVVTEIKLEPLGLDHTAQWVADTLHATLDRVMPLARSLMDKTAGNPFFLTQLLKSLHDDGLIWFNAAAINQAIGKQGKWQWDLEQIQNQSITANVIDLMIGKITKLAQPTQRMLQLAACIGNSFDLQTLAVVSEQSLSQTAQELWEAIQAGLIVPVGKGYRLPQVFDAQEVVDMLVKGQAIAYRFLHDRVQQAAYVLIPSDRQQATHLKIGQLLLSHTAETEQAEKVFELVGHLNQGIALMTAAPERQHLAQLNLVAGCKAKAASAYGTAMQYLGTGMDLLPPDRWQSQYDLTLAIALTLAETAYLNTHFDQAEALADEILSHTRNLLDQVKVYELNVQMYTARNQLQQAVDTGLMILELLQIPLADAPPDGLMIQDLYHLPIMVSAEKLLALKLLITIAAPAYNTNPALVPRLTLTMIDLCVNHGNSAMAAYAYAFYGMLLCATRENIELGYEFGRLALWIMGKFEARDLQGKVHHLFNVGIRHWKEPARATLDSWQDTIQWNLEAGDIGYACYAAMGYCINLFLVGEVLDVVRAKQIPYIDLIQQLKQTFPLYGTTVWGQLVMNLSDPASDRTQLIGEFFNEPVALPILHSSNNLQTLCALHLSKTMLHYWFHDYEQAATHITLAVGYADAMTGLLASAQLPFYESLVGLARYATLDANAQCSLLDQVTQNQQRMKLWADHAPVNFQHKYDLIEAETARALGQFWDAAEWYDRAIAGATANGYIQEAALANELAAKFYLDWGKVKVAAGYLQEAYEGYAQWGAIAKLADLETRYPQLLAPIIQQPYPSPDVDDSIAQTRDRPSSSSSTTSILDLTTVIKASQAISQVIQIEQLLGTLMQVVMQNTGAQTGSFILKIGDTWQQVAQCPTAETCHLENRTFDAHLPLPLSVIHYVQRTQSVVVIDDRVTQSQFVTDPYWLQHQPKSVLCVPILSQGKLIGILYLENQITAGAFTRDRQEVVQLIAAQAAISLENAQLYSTLEQKVKARTQELSQALADLQATQQELIQSEKMAALGQLTASIAHEINTPLGVIRAATTNIAAAFNTSLQQLPVLLQALSPEQQTEFLSLIHRVLQSSQSLSSASERQLRRHWQTQLQAQGIEEPARLATHLTLLRLEGDLSPYQSLITAPNAMTILETAYHLVQQHQNNRSIQQEVDRAAKIVFALKTYSHQSETDERSWVDLTESLEVVLTLYQNRFKQNVAVIRQYAKALPPLLCNPDDLAQVWVNLIDNALYAIREQGTLEIAVAQQGDRLIVVITDSGQGIPSAIQSRIFDPFFTTKPRGEGSGLGLDIVRQIVSKHGGDIQVTSEPGRTAFTVQLPLQPKRSEELAESGGSHEATSDES